jgi:FKBP-type peptidyl-prolyl cis-trans isomerase FkpA
MADASGDFLTDEPRPLRDGGRAAHEERDAMRKSWVLAVLTGLVVVGCGKQGGGAGGQAGQAKAPQTEEEKTLYALGVWLGRNVEVFSLTPQELQVVQQGFGDSVQGKPLAVEFQPYQQKVSELARTRGQAKSESEGKKRGEEAGANKEKGKAFLEKAAQEPGAQKSGSGLIYIEQQAGTGPQPTAADRVKVNYRGTLIDGKEFDSSAKHGGPATFPLGGVIKCWTEGVGKMKVGGKAKLVCPSEIAYGEQGAGKDIPPGSTLVFEVELLGIEGK